VHDEACIALRLERWLTGANVAHPPTTPRKE
jgi:hypothetical protein